MTNLTNLDDFFQSAQEDGLTEDALDLVIANLNGPAVATAVHTPLDQLTSNDVTLAMNIIDMSGSMAAYANDLIRAYNQDYLAAMRHSPAADDILVSTILFHDETQMLHGYLPLPDAPPLDNQIYVPDNSTALYDAVAAGMTSMILYAQQLRQSGVSARGVIIIYTDGADNASRQSAQEVRRAAQDVLRQELYTLVLVGFGLPKPIGFAGANGRAPAQQLADEIGFPIGLDAGLNAFDLQRIFRLASMTAVQVSQSGAAPVFAFAA